MAPAAIRMSPRRRATGLPQMSEGRRAWSLPKARGLSARETEVLALVLKGRDLPYIAEKLVVSKNTVRTHMRNIYAKLGVHSKQEVIDLVDGQGGER